MYLCCLLIVGWFSLASYRLASADVWHADLNGRGTVKVDAETRKPIVNYSGRNTQLWNGIHKLADDSVITVRNGVAVPNEAMYQTWTDKPPPLNQPQLDICAQLVRRVCGIQYHCGNSPACGLAKQAQRLDTDALKHTTDSVLHYDQDTCRKAMLDLVIFPVCKQDIEVPTPCIHLVIQTCGSNAQCQATPACDAARQLLSLEQEARSDSQNVADENNQFDTQQCQDALDNPFFVNCKESMESKKIQTDTNMNHSQTTAK